MKNIIIYFLLIFTFILSSLIIISCDNKSKIHNDTNDSNLSGFDSIVYDLKVKEILNQPLINVVNKLNINLESNKISFAFYDEPEYDTLDINKNFDYFLFYEYDKWSVIELSIQLNYKELPFYILNSSKNDSLIWSKVKNKKIKRFSVRTNEIQLLIIDK